MAEETNAAKVAPSPKSVKATNDHGTGGSHQQQLKEEVGPLVRSPNDATPALHVNDPAIYQADVVEGETTAKPAEGAAAPEAAAASPATGEAPVAPAEGEAASTTPAAADAAAAPAAEGSPAAAEGAAPAGETAEGAPSPSPEAPAAGAAETTAAPGGAESSVAPGGETSTAPADAAGVTTTVGPVTGSPTTKDPYAIDIPLDKKINKRTQRKLWEEIEKRKPLVPKHVAQHIQKYAKPPFETYGCKYRGKGSCSNCSK